MAEDPTESADTIEWGDAPPERQGWLARLTGSVPTDARTPQMPQEPRQRLNYVALGLAVVGFLGVLAAQYLPWMHLDLSGLTDANSSAQRLYDFSVGAINTWQNMAYGLSVLAVFATTACLLVAGPGMRRPLAATALGLLAGQLSLLVGMARAIGQGAGLGAPTALSALPDSAVSIGPGYSVAVIATALFMAAVLVAARPPRLSHPRAADKLVVHEDQPIDLVVTPLPDDSQWRDVRSDSLAPGE